MQIKKLMALLAAGTLALSAFSVVAAPAKGDKEKKESKAAAKDAKPSDPNQFDAWRLTCQTNPETKSELCSLDQPLTQVLGKDPADETKVKVRLFATIGVVRLPGSDKPQMLIKAPLGSFLQTPVLKVPGHKDVGLPYLVCDKDSCSTIAMGLEKEFLDAVKAAETAETTPENAQGTLVIAMQVNRPDQPQPKLEAVNIKFALKGFSRGLEALTKKMPAAMPAPVAKTPAPAVKK
jgi:invasion protein IalB